MSVGVIQKENEMFTLKLYIKMQGGDDSSTTPTSRMPSSRSRQTDEPHIGKYRLIKTIGKGNFAKVKLAKHVPTGREVSILICFHHII